jgi:hypothetical protein
MVIEMQRKRIFIINPESNMYTFTDCLRQLQSATGKLPPSTLRFRCKGRKTSVLHLTSTLTERRSFCGWLEMKLKKPARGTMHTISDHHTAMIRVLKPLGFSRTHSKV